MREPSGSFRRVRALLLTAGQTESNRALRSLFAAPRLRPWQGDLPEAGSREERVDTLLAYLGDKQRGDGERALVLLLRELAERVDPGDSRHDAFRDLAQALAVRPAAPESAPYRGLLPFRAEDSGFFFGREDVVKQLLATVRRRPALVPVLGASGSGKSSVIFAGLLPRLEAGGSWKVLHFRPGRRPLAALAAALVDALNPELPEVTRQEEIGKLAGGLEEGTLTPEPFLARLLEKEEGDGRLLLVADQFEELFTLAPEERRGPFLDVWLAQMPLPLTRVLTMRADFLGQALRYPSLADALQGGDVKLAPMRPEQLQAAIERPAALVDVAFEPGLVDRILSDLQGEPGNLPLLQFALTQLWRRQSRGQMTHAAYEAIGGVEGALAQYADEVYESLSPAEQERARHLFVQFVAPGLGTEDTRRVAERAELGDAQWALVQQLADRRLVVTGEAREELAAETAEVAHEALIQHWERLQTWMTEDRLFRAWQERLRLQLQQWQETGEDEGALLRGAPLAEAEGWLAEREAQLSRAERAYIAAGVALREAEAAERDAARQQALEMMSARARAETARSKAEARRATEQAAAAQRLRRRAYALGGLLLLAVLLAGLSLLLFSRASDSEAVAETRAAELAGESTRAAQNLAAAERAQEEAIAQAEQAAQNLAVAEEAQQEAEAQASLAFARQLAAQSLALPAEEYDRSLLLAIEAAAITQTWETRNSLLTTLQAQPRVARFLHGHDDNVADVVFSPDGDTLATAGSDGAILLWDLATGQPRQSLTGAHLDGVTSVAFSRDGQTVASGDGDGSIVFWDVETGAPRRAPLKAHGDSVTSVAFSPDGETLASGGGDDLVKFWNVETGEQIGEPLSGHRGTVNGVAFSANGDILAAAGQGYIVLWDVATRESLDSLHEGTRAWPVASIAFSENADILAAGFDNGSIRVWDLETMPPELAITSYIPTFRHGEYGVPLTSVALSPDGLSLVSGSEDRTLMLWNLAGNEPRGEPLGEPLGAHPNAVSAVAFSPDGSTLASASLGGGTIVWDLATSPRLGRPLAAEDSGSGGVGSVAFRNDGRMLAWSRSCCSAYLWDVAGDKQVGSPLDGGGRVVALTFSPNGSKLAAGTSSHTIRLWNVETGQPLSATLAGHEDQVRTVTFSPDGAVLASSGEDGGIILWDGETLEPLNDAVVGDGEAVVGVAFSQDGQRLVTGSEDGTVRRWDVKTLQPLGEPLSSLAGGVASMSVTQDGSTLALGGFDGTVSLWDLGAGRPLDNPLIGHSGAVVSIASSPDGETLASGGGNLDGAIILWDARTRQPLGQPLSDQPESTVLSLAFSPQGETLASVGRYGPVMVWQVGVDAWQAEACRRANRNLTDAEWRLYFGDTPYRETCPGLDAPRED